MARVESPCIRVCKQDDAAGFCIGCGRTVMEVFRWIDYSDEERRQIMAGLASRLQTLRRDDTATEPGEDPSSLRTVT